MTFCGHECSSTADEEDDTTLSDMSGKTKKGLDEEGGPGLAVGRQIEEHLHSSDCSSTFSFSYRPPIRLSSLCHCDVVEEEHLPFFVAFLGTHQCRAWSLPSFCHIDCEAAKADTNPMLMPY